MGFTDGATNPDVANPLRRVYTSKRNRLQAIAVICRTDDTGLRHPTGIRNLQDLQSCCCNYFVDVLSAELWQLNRSWVFQGHGASLQPQTMLLDEGHQRLYVGAKNTLFSLSLDRVNADPREVGQTVWDQVRHTELVHHGGNWLAKQSSFILYMNHHPPPTPAGIMVVWSIFKKISLDSVIDAAFYRL